MVLVYDGVQHLTCVTTDTKPTTLPTNHIALETDTGIEWIWNGSAWRMRDPFLTELKRFGHHALQNVQGDGTWGNLSNAGLVAGLDTTLKRKYMRMSTTTTSGTTVGWRDASVSHTERSANPKLYVEFRVNQITNQRIYIGYRASTTQLSGEDPLNASAGFLFGARAADSAWQILSNDATGATVVTAVTAVTTIDTNMHKVWVIADGSNNKFGISVDGNAFQYITSSTDIPAATTAIAPHIEIQNSAAEDKQMDVFHFYEYMDNG